MQPYHQLRLFQLIGRAGRDGSTCRAHIITNTREVEQSKDPDLTEFCKCTENCRRKVLLRSLGSTENLPTSSVEMCCDVCSPSTLSCAVVDLFKHVPTKRRARRLVARALSSSQYAGLKKALEQERDAIVASDVGYNMLGKEIVMPTACIVELCKMAKYVTCEDDIKCVPGLRSVFVSRIFSVMMSFFV